MQGASHLQLKNRTQVLINGEMPKTESKGLALTGLWEVWPVCGSHGVTFNGFCWPVILPLSCHTPQLPLSWQQSRLKFLGKTPDQYQLLCCGHFDQDFLLFLLEVQLLTPIFVIPSSPARAGPPPCLVHFVLPCSASNLTTTRFSSLFSSACQTTVLYTSRWATTMFCIKDCITVVPRRQQWWQLQIK